MASNQLRRILITGGSQGIGKSIALEFAKYDTQIALLSRDIDKLRNNAKLIEQFGSKAYIYQCDVSNKNEVEIGRASCRERV